MAEEKKEMSLQDLENMPWYQSTQGPQVSRTLIYVISGTIIPVVKQLFGWEVDNNVINALIELGVIGFFGIMALRSHLKAKNSLIEKMGMMKYDK